MNPLVEVVKSFFIPGSITFLMFGLIVGVTLLYFRDAAAKWGKRWLTLLAVLYWTLSTPLCSNTLEAILSHGYETQASPVEVEGIEAIVVLGGGSSTLRSAEQEMDALSNPGILRVWEGARLYENLDQPWVIVSGGMNERAGALTPESMPMRDVLIDIGVPADRILLESSSRNTFEQAVYLHSLLDIRGIERFALVTSPTHMRRAIATFIGQGLNPIPSSSSQHSDGFLADRWVFLPDKNALEASRLAMREGMALVYYTLRGWFSPP